MKLLLGSLEKLDVFHDVVVVEFDKLKHMDFAKDIMDYDEELSTSQTAYNPAVFDDTGSLGKISYSKYIDLLLENNWRLFVVICDGKCIGYFHTTPGKYKDSVYIGSFIITKAYAGKGYGKTALKQFEKLIANDYSIMILNVAVNNKAAVKLYTKSGFHTSHVTMSKKLKH